MPRTIASGSGSEFTNNNSFPMGEGLGQLRGKNVNFEGKGAVIENPDAACYTGRHPYKSQSPYAGKGTGNGGY